LIGSRQRVPPPFGQAENGLLVFVKDGKVVTFDPASQVERPLVVGLEGINDPAWSLDGMRLAFLRREGRGDRLVFVDRDGGHTVFGDATLVGIDPDSVTWSPSGREVLLVAGPEPSRAFYTVDALDGEVSMLTIDDPNVEAFWRPPDGRDLLISTKGRTAGIYVFSMENETMTLLRQGDAEEIRPRGWSPDGRRAVLSTTFDAALGFRTLIIDVATGDTVMINAGAGRLSNDGTRVAAYHVLDDKAYLCVAQVSDGRCHYVGDRHFEPDIFHGDGLSWSPDDEWVVVFPATGTEVVLIDPDGVDNDMVIPADGAASWQRAADPP
jgi:Tol biopolymer transport system component